MSFKKRGNLPFEIPLPVIATLSVHLLAAPVLANEPVGFEKLVLTSDYYCDGIQAGDINRDGRRDVVAGPFWYEGPEFKKAHAFYPPARLAPEESPSDSMFSFVHDFSGDGWPDILVLGRVHLHPAFWYENPRGADGYWPRHFAFERVRGESPPFVDLEGDGRPQLVCHWEGRWGWIEPDPDRPREPWRFRALSDPGGWKEFYHGTGVGDLDGDGRLDLVLNDGWFLQPKPSSPPKAGQVWKWRSHRFSPGRGGAQMIVYDVDADGDADVITSLDAHGWGLAWFEQRRNRGEITFRPHPFMGTRDEIDRYGVAFSQPHALALGDLDGDGAQDVVVGKRRWAHGPTGDVEPSAEPVLYWFELERTGRGVRFVPHLIDNSSGVGVQIQVTDVNADGRNDVLTASKLGSFVFLNLAARSRRRTSLVPRRSRQQHRHAAGVGDARENEARARERGQADEVRMHEEAQRRSQDDDEAGGDADLPLERDRFLAAHDRQARLLPAERPPLDVDDVGTSRLAKLLAGLLGPVPRAANHVQGPARAVSLGDEERRIQPIQRQVRGEGDVDLSELGGRSHIDEIDRRAGSKQIVQRFWRDGERFQDARLVPVSLSLRHIDSSRSFDLYGKKTHLPPTPNRPSMQARMLARCGSTTR